MFWVGVLAGLKELVERPTQKSEKSPRQSVTKYRKYNPQIEQDVALSQIK